MATCTQCQAAIEPHTYGRRPQRSDWCRQCRKREYAARNYSKAGHAACDRYRQSEHGRAVRARYEQSGEGRATRAAYQQRVSRQQMARELQARYRETAQYREWRARHVQTDAYRTRTARHRQSAKYRVRYKRYRQTQVWRAAMRRWRQTETGRAATRRTGAMRRARAAGATILESVDRRRIYELDTGLCHLCDLPVEPQAFHVDHLIPIAVEPIEAEFNCALAHPTCNVRKWKRLIVLSTTARARWQARRPEHLAELDAHVARILAAPGEEVAA